MTGEPGSGGLIPHPLGGGRDDKARMRGTPKSLSSLRRGDVHASVLILLGGRPLQVLLVRKSCDIPSPWACDVALPGGRLRPGEDPVSAALREAWEEANIWPGYVRVLGSLDVHTTRVSGVRVAPIIGLEGGPLDPRPASPEVDAVFWFSLRDIMRHRVERVTHPKRGEVEGMILDEGLVLWGLTLRILNSLYRKLPDLQLSRML